MSDMFIGYQIGSNYNSLVLRHYLAATHKHFLTLTRYPPKGVSAAQRFAFFCAELEKLGIDAPIYTPYSPKSDEQV